MAYTADITRANPSAFLFLIDQSGSMADEFRQSDTPLRKDAFVTDALNRTLQNLAIRCNRDEGIRDYYHITVLGYGKRVGPALTGALADQTSIPISTFMANPARIEDRPKKIADGAGGLVETTVKFPVWVDPSSDGGTPMCAAFAAATSILRDWTAGHMNAFPPLVFNFTDGESTDGDPTNLAHELTRLATDDGPVLLFNVHVSASSPYPIRFPCQTDALPDKYAELLCRTSSPLTPGLADAFSGLTGQALTSENACFIYNAGPEDIVNALEIGTRAATILR